MKQLFRWMASLLVCTALGTNAFAELKWTSHGASGCPTAPTPVTPANNAVENFGPVTFSWSSVPGATSYELYAALDGDPLSSLGSTAGTSKTISIEPGRSVEWKVVANAPSCPGSASAHFFFTTTCPSTPPSAIAPGEGATIAPGQNINFNWTPVPGATSYDVKISADGGNDWQVIAENIVGHTLSVDAFAPGAYLWEVRTNFDGDCDPLYSAPRQLFIGAGCTDTSAPQLMAPAANATVKAPVTFRWTAVAEAIEYQLLVRRSGANEPRIVATTQATEWTTSDLDSGANEWAVRVVFDACPALVSEIRTLDVEGLTGCPRDPEEATLLSPSNNATGLSSPVTFRWNAVAGATGYRVLASFNNAAPILLGTTTTTQLIADVPAGTGYWVVQTLFGDECPSTLSARRTLTVANGASCNGAAPQLIAPANNATNVASPVTFRWNAVADATKYRLFVATGDDDFAFYGETSETQLTRFVPAGAVRWFVIASFAACPDARSSTGTFSARGAQECAAAQITLLTPTENATATSPVHVSWTPVANAAFYRVWVSVNGAAPVNLLRTTTTSADLRLPAGAIRWYVDASRPDCDAVVSNEGRFTVSQGANCASNTAPTLVAPLGTRENPANVGTPVTLSWTAVANAIGYRIWISRDLKSFEDVTLTKETQVTLPLDGGVHAWYAEAFFEGCAPVRSPTAFFRVAAADLCGDAPTAVSPAPGSVTQSPVTFVWTSVERAIKYRVFLSVDGSEAQLVGVTDETQLTRTLPPGVATWSVEAVFERCASQFSPRTSFTIETAENCSNEAAQLVSPANDSTTSASTVTFTWNPVSGALRYVVLASVNDGTPTVVASTTDTSVTRDMPAGVIRWRVMTLFSGCEPVESPEWRFTISRNTACENRKPILLLPTDDNRALPSPVHFQWTAVPNATRYLLWARRGEEDFSIVASTTEPAAEAELATGRYEYFVEAQFDGCESTRSARGEFVVTAPVACGTPLRPEAQVVGQALSNTKYKLRWTPLPNVALYEVQESTSLDFANATTRTSHVPVLQFSHEVAGAPVQYLYRVRGVSDCGNGDRGPYSDVVGVFVTPPRTNNASAEIGSEDVIVQTVTLPASLDALSFTATADKPWITITPSTGTLTAAAPTVLTVKADPAFLSLGTNTGTISVAYSGGSAAKGPHTEATSSLKIPLSVSLVTPVTPATTNTPPPDSLIFPIVGHATGANDSLFESDIRITNLTAQTMRYELHFTPSNTDGTTSGSASTIEIAPNATLALDDIVASLFGTGTTSSATGMLEVRPLTTSSEASSSFFSPATNSAIRELTTAAASRTYNFTPNGTFGQFIPAVRFADFVGKSATGTAPSILSLQQVAQSSAYRANFGFGEASGAPADLAVRVYDTASTLLKTINVSLKAGEHQQLNGMLSANGITELADGRVEVEVTGGEGKVTAYVSEVDNKTNDPLLVSPVLKGAVTANKYVVPGVAYLDNPTAFWVTDLRVFNAGSSATPATVTFYPERNPGAAITREITLNAGEIEVLDNVLVSLFGQTTNIGGAIAITTPSDAQLTATARTYNKKTSQGGTYGQYIPGVTPAQSVGVNDRALQILQLEQSSRFRTNIGLNETAGQAATIEVMAIVPDLLVTPVLTINLQPNEFQQISLANFGLGDSLYNARVTVKVISGNGRVTAYGSAIDATTQDPTYVPAQ